VTPEARLVRTIEAHRAEVIERLSRLEWAADPADPNALVGDPALVRPRVELFLETLLEGLAGGDWSRFEASIGARTVDLLASGVVSAAQLERRALTMTNGFIGLVVAEDDPEPMLAALFGAMQAVSSRIVGSYNERLLAESKQLDDLKTMFMRVTGHELRAPLGVIRGYASMLRDGDLGAVGPAQGEALAGISLSAASALSILDRLGEIARLESGSEAVQRAPARLAEVVEAAVEPLRGAARQKAVELHVEVRDAEASLDAEEVAIAIRNLVGNALKYASDGGHVTIRAYREGAGAVFEVADRGPGIPEAELDLVFDRYYRSTARAHETIPGSGLGLYIVRRIADLHDGEVSVQNAPAGGALFQIRLPAEPKGSEPG
jgi:signal transduction histidine kinase